MTFDWQFAWSILPQLAKAAQLTFLITLSSFGVALIGGMLLLYLRMSKSRLVARPVAWVIDFIRGTPLLVQVFLIYYIGPNYGLRLGPIETGILALGVHYSCYMSEIYRTAFQAVGRGQWEAARALGLNPRRTFQKVIWPQMWPVVVPLGGSYLVYMFKDTPILAAITVRELMQVAAQIGADNFRYMEPVTIVGALFLVMSVSVAYLTRVLERRVAVR
jgi:polar amino acid transport system permease protein